MTRLVPLSHPLRPHTVTIRGIRRSARAPTVIWAKVAAVVAAMRATATNQATKAMGLISAGD